MKQFFLVLKVVASNWKKAKGQLIFTILGIAIASTLWSSIDIVNNQTIKAQKQSIDLLKSAFKPIIIDRELPYVSQGDYLNLRLNGWIVNPVIRAPLEGSDIIIIGIDLLADRKKITLSQNNGSFGNLTIVLVSLSSFLKVLHLTSELLGFFPFLSACSLYIQASAWHMIKETSQLKF